MDMIERVARALWFDFIDQQGYPNGLPTWDEMEAWPATDRNNRCAEYRSLARAALGAMREPTDAMIAAASGTETPGSSIYGEPDEPNYCAAWMAMLDAALAGENVG